MEPLLNLAKQFNLRIIEDAAQAPGALSNNKWVGTQGDV